MTYKKFIFFLLLLIATCCIAQKDSSKMLKQYTSEQLRNNVIADAADFNNDDTKVLIDNNSSGIFNIYLVNVADTARQPLTASATNSYYAVGFLPGTDKFIFTHDEGGNENNRLYLMKEGDTAAKDLTPWTNSKNSFFDWSVGKKSMYVSSNRRDPKFFDIWKLDTATWKPALFYQNDSGLDASVISKSERYIALTKPVTTDKNEMYLYDRTNKTMKRISNNNEAMWNPSAIEKNDSIFYYTTNDRSEFTYLINSSC